MGSAALEMGCGKQAKIGKPERIKRRIGNGIEGSEGYIRGKLRIALERTPEHSRGAQLGTVDRSYRLIERSHKLKV